MNGLLLLLVSLLPVATVPPVQVVPPCSSIYLDLGPTVPPDGTWHIAVIDAHGPWLLVHGTLYDPTAHPVGKWKGCDLWTGGALTLLGPFSGNLFATFVPPGPMYPGCWQVLCSGPPGGPAQTSNPVCGP